jgi:hypothetical protein
MTPGEEWDDLVWTEDDPDDDLAPEDEDSRALA